MVSFLSFVSVVVTVLSVVGSVQAVPLADKLKRLSPSARDVLKSSTPAAPHFVVYNDKWINPLPSASQLQGFNVFALTFLLASGSVDQAQNWQELTDSQRNAFVQEYNAAGISLIVSAFGSTETPTSSGVDPVGAANSMAAWVLQHGVNGIDVDYEDFTAFNGGGGKAEAWLISYTQQLRSKLPQGQYIISHAPVAPWFSPNMWSGGGYLAVHKSVGSLIDWYNVQFYNQGTSEYTTCSGLLTASSSAWPESALFQIAANGVSLDKIVIGKPATSSDASNGYIDPSTLASCVAQAATKGWTAGVMSWQYPDATSAWMFTVRGNTWPASGSPPPSPTITTPSSPATPTTPSPTTSVTSSPATPTTPSPTTLTPPSPTETTTPSSPTTPTPPSTATTTSHSPKTPSSPSPTTTTATSSPTSTGKPGSGKCTGVSSWANSVPYLSGSKVTYNGDLWVANQWNQDETPGGYSGAWTKDGAC